METCDHDDTRYVTILDAYVCEYCGDVVDDHPYEPDPYDSVRDSRV